MNLSRSGKTHSKINSKVRNSPSPLSEISVILFLPLEAYNKSMPAGIYLHIPFCKSRCSYCDFATDVYKNSEAVERYVSALCKEIKEFRSPHVSDDVTPVDTIYFGGGTPSLLTPGQ